MRVPVSEFGRLLLAKVMGGTDVQESLLQMLFRFADEQGLALYDLVDLIEVIRYLTSDEGRAIQDEYGGLATGLAERLAPAASPPSLREPKGGGG